MEFWWASDDRLKTLPCVHWLAGCRVVCYLFLTAGKTLEDMTDIFEAKNPVLKSLDRITYDEDGNILIVQPAKRYRL